MGAEIENLTEDLLAEILHRLPYKDSRRCLCVCKAWSLLVSQPSFIKKLIMTFHRRPNNQQQQQQQQPAYYHVLLDFPYTTDHVPSSLGVNVPCCTMQGEDSEELPVLDRPFGFLPKRDGDEVEVLRVSGDLLLCGHPRMETAGRSRLMRAHSGSTDDYYYVCNVVTQEWAALPPRPHHHGCRPEKKFQFYSSRFYDEDPSNDTIYNPEYEYVVLISTGVPEKVGFPLKVDIFSSKDKVWRTLALPIPRGFKCFEGYWLSNSCLHEGILWGSDEVRVVRLNVKDPQDEPRLIPLPLGAFYPCEPFIGVCDGRFRVAARRAIPLEDGEFKSTSLVMVWELVEGWKWDLVHEIDMADLCSHSKTLKEGGGNSNSNSNSNIIPEGYWKHISNIWFHPNDRDVVFVEHHRCIVEWNAGTKDFKHYGKATGISGRMFLTLPACPTPVRPLNDVDRKNCVFDPPIIPVLPSIWEQVDLFIVLGHRIEIDWSDIY